MSGVPINFATGSSDKFLGNFAVSILNSLPVLDQFRELSIESYPLASEEEKARRDKDRSSPSLPGVFFDVSRLIMERRKTLPLSICIPAINIISTPFGKRTAQIWLLLLEPLVSKILVHRQALGKKHGVNQFISIACSSVANQPIAWPNSRIAMAWSTDSRRAVSVKRVRRKSGIFGDDVSANLHLRFPNFLQCRHRVNDVTS